MDHLQCYVNSGVDPTQILNYVPKIARNNCSEYRWVNRPQNDRINALYIVVYDIAPLHSGV